MNTNNIQKVNYQKILDKITDKIEKECAEGRKSPSSFPSCMLRLAAAMFLNI